MKQIPTSETVLEGHRDSVNTMKFNADLTFLLSGGTLFYSSIILITVLTDCLDNSGFIIIWDLVLRAPFQKIDAALDPSLPFAGSIYSKMLLRERMTRPSPLPSVLEQVLLLSTDSPQRV